MIPSNNLRITGRRRAPIARPRLAVLLLLGRRSRGSAAALGRGPVVHASRALRGLDALLLRRVRVVALVALGLGVVVAVVVHKDVDAPLLGVAARDRLVVVLVLGLGVAGDDVPRMKEAGDLFRATDGLVKDGPGRGVGGEGRRCGNGIGERT